MKPDRMREPPPTIRPATQADTEVVVRIYIVSWNAGFGSLLSRDDRTVTTELTERWRRDLGRDAPHRWWVAEREGSIVGFVGIGPSRDPVDPQLGEVDTIAVDPPHWRTGVGRALMSVAVRHLSRTATTMQYYGRLRATSAASPSTRAWDGDGTGESATRDGRSASGTVWPPR